MWCLLPENVKSSWVEAGKTINYYDELSKSIPHKVSKMDFQLELFYLFLLPI